METVDASPVQLPAPAPPPVYTVTRHVAQFSGGDLDECVDIEGTSATPLDAGVLNGIAPEASPIPKPCAEQFPGRAVLGTCSFTHTGDGGAISFRSHRYRFAVVGTSDEAAKECLEMRGDWQELDRSSAAWKRAKIEHARKRLDRAIDQTSPPSE